MRFYDICGGGRKCSEMHTAFHSFFVICFHVSLTKVSQTDMANFKNIRKIKSYLMLQNKPGVFVISPNGCQSQKI